VIIVRPMENQEYDFFMDTHYESIYILQGKPSKHDLLNDSNIKKYSEDWGRMGDKALVALRDDIPVGAVWYRLFDDMNKGYGYIDCETPELGIAIHTNFRQQGLGLMLMEKIIQQAKFDNYKSLSLSVDPENQAAVRLYEKLGFEHCGLSGTSLTMKINVCNK
jgi:ribosomal protein S18 acetylase RimI-like enzyme